MAELSLTDVFGAGATQNATTITISKADLPGLTAAANNKPDSIMLALANRLTGVYTAAVRAVNPDVSLVVSLNTLPGTSGDFNVTPPQPYLVYTYNLAVHLPLPATIPDPDEV